MHFLIHSSISNMESSKNKQAAKNRQEEIKKAAAALRAQGGGLLAQVSHASKKRNHTPNVQSLGKGVGGSSVCLEVHEGVVDPPHHGVGKGLMTSQGPVIPLLLPLLMKDKEYVVDTACSIVRDTDLDECSEHEIDPLGDFGLHDMMSVSPLIHSLAIVLSVYIDRPFILIVLLP